MQYLALIYGEEGRWADLSQEEREREMGEYMALSQADVTKGGNELDSTATATTVRVRGDETLVTDGPFAELKESARRLLRLRVRLDRRGLHAGRRRSRPRSTARSRSGRCTSEEGEQS